MPPFWTPGDVYPGFQSQGGSIVIVCLYILVSHVTVDRERTEFCDVSLVFPQVFAGPYGSMCGESAWQQDTQKVHARNEATLSTHSQSFKFRNIIL